MSVVFTPRKLGPLEIRNRFVHSATYEAMAARTGEVTEGLVKRYRKLSDGGVGLVIPGFMFVHAHGRAQPLQTGIHTDAMVPGLRKLADAAHGGGARIVFQLCHAGGQTSAAFTGHKPLGPSARRRDPIYLGKPAPMTEHDIRDTVNAFGEAARRAAEAGADGVQIHAAHGYLGAEFLSPFFNEREDGWGGSDENRFRFLEEVFVAVRRSMPSSAAVLVKMNWSDHVPGGVTPAMAAAYCARLARLGVDAVEISSGTAHSFMNIVRGDVPAEELVRMFPLWKKILGRMMMRKLVGKYGVVEGYNLEGVRAVKAALREVPVIAVGGMRTLAFMEQVVARGDAEFVSLSRPFVREPSLVRRFREGKAVASSCASCNQCFAAVGNGLPLTCYNKTVPRAEA